MSTVEVSSKKCQVRVSYKSVKYECLTRVSSKKCHTRVSSKKCQARVSYQSVAQQCQARVSVLFLTFMSAFGFVGFILFFFESQTKNSSKDSNKNYSRHKVEKKHAMSPNIMGELRLPILKYFDRCLNNANIYNEKNVMNNVMKIA